MRITIVGEGRDQYSSKEVPTAAVRWRWATSNLSLSRVLNVIPGLGSPDRLHAS